MRPIEKFLDRLIPRKLQTRLTLGFLVAACLTGIIATIVGTHLISKNTLNEVQRRVREDINTAKLIYNYNLERIVSQLEISIRGSNLHDAIISRDIKAMENLRELVRYVYWPIPPRDFRRLDILTVIDSKGTVLFRANNPRFNGDDISSWPVVRACLESQIPVSSTELMKIENIEKETPGISMQINKDIIETPYSVALSESRLSDCMVLMAACPIFDNQQRFLGALIGCVLVNGDQEIVDAIKTNLYRNEKYKNRDIGYATIFQGGVRVSTNVRTKYGARAVGTKVSKAVYETVILENKEWIGRAFVVNDWYISAYTPIYNLDDAIIGMLYTGLLEIKYNDMKNQTLLIFLSITILGMLVAFLISFYLGNTIVKRVRILKGATEAIAAGNLDYRLAQDTYSGFGVLDEAFNNMTRSLRDRDERLQKAFQRITRTERLAALGQMAAGIAHEINNPLGGILLYSNLVLEELSGEKVTKENMEKIIYQTERCKKIVQNLLDFARAPSGDMMSIEINHIILNALNLVKDQSMFLGIEIEITLEDSLPPIKGDQSRLEEVFLNLFVNAADSMEGTGKLEVCSRLTSTGSIMITISDTGKGIDKAYLPHIFEPFFTTKDPGKGTGLGLFIAFGIIRGHNGFIDVESEVGKGTKFIIRLPVFLGTEDEGKIEQKGKEKIV